MRITHKIEKQKRNRNHNHNQNRTLFFLPGFLVFAAEGIGAAAIESETMAEPLDLISKNKRFAKTLICEGEWDDRKF